MTEEIRGNKAVENAAIAWVMNLERAVGREPADTRERGVPADISSPPRQIEVKAFERQTGVPDDFRSASGRRLYGAPVRQVLRGTQGRS